MADKPSRALVIYGDGHASLVSPSHGHLHSFASRASCGFLSLRAPPPSETDDESLLRELAQLLDAYDFYVARDKKLGADANIDLKEVSTSTISERFMGLRAALFSSCPSVRSFARYLGFSALQIHELIEPTDSSDELLQEVPANSAVVSKLLQLLGFLGGDVLEKCEFDLVFLHIKVSEESKDSTNIDWLNKLVGGLMQTAQPGSNIASRLHFSVVLSYGTVSESDQRCSLIVNSSTETDSDLSLLRPRQSYTMKGGNTLNDIRHYHPMLIAQWQEGVTRRDMARAFSFGEFKEHGGNLAILADRFLHEVAFKLWKAPKYGA